MNSPRAWRTRATEPADFSIVLVPSTLDLTGLESQLERIWKGLQSRAATQGMPLWNGLHYRLENLGDMRKGSTTLALSTVPYAHVRSLLELGRTRRLTVHQEARNVNTGALIRTRDGKLVFGGKHRPGRRVRLDLVGGGLQVDELAVRTGRDLACNMHKEIHEELNVPSCLVERTRLVGQIYTATFAFILLFEVQCACSSPEVMRAFASRHDTELDELVVVDGRYADAFLRGAGGYLPLLGPFARNLAC